MHTPRTVIVRVVCVCVVRWQRCVIVTWPNMAAVHDRWVTPFGLPSN